MEKQQILTSLHSAHEYFEPLKHTMDLYESLVQQMIQNKAKRNHSVISNIACIISCIGLFSIVYFNPNINFSIHSLTFWKVVLLTLWIACLIGIPVCVKIAITKIHQKRTDHKIEQLKKRSTPLYDEILESYLEFQDASFLSLPFSYCYPDYIEKLAQYIELQQANSLKEAISILQAELSNQPSNIFHHLVLNAQQIAAMQSKDTHKPATQSV
ncbi:hypothetical protein RBG61_08050 [Paludicola sp. MB14-C6]|uniref:hypothetical protein n=1 Tax=Paludihabitans sp. MB14-C6 TaxID=3070656 RepID=UPI0027DE0E1E|nr:hypothetical protein [Paludicola sp. MB14-C6]WMJ21950.1 hypothetical protein RBG61_08050 [Paludicola sp. MB14-C6]